MLDWPTRYRPEVEGASGVASRGGVGVGRVVIGSPSCGLPVSGWAMMEEEGLVKLCALSKSLCSRP